MQLARTLLAIGCLQGVTAISLPPDQSTSRIVGRSLEGRRVTTTWLSSHKVNMQWEPLNSTKNEPSGQSKRLGARGTEEEEEEKKPKLTDSCCHFFDRWNERTPCDHFVVAFGNANEFHADPKFVEFEGDGWTETFYLDCGPGEDGKEWNEFDSEWVPGIEIHPGNTCFVKPGKDEFDNTWIRMNGHIVNVADPESCAGRDPWGKGRRCVVAWDDVRVPRGFTGITCTKNVIGDAARLGAILPPMGDSDATRASR